MESQFEIRLLRDQEFVDQQLAGREGGGRFVLLCDPDTTCLAPLVKQLLLKPDALTSGFWISTRMDGVTVGQALR